MLPEALRFQVGLIDQISKPLGNIQRQLNDVTNTYRQGTHTMMAGAAGMVGAGFALQQALMPAIEMDRALGEVKSLGVAEGQLKTLAQTAMKFSVEYGKSATEFVAASYDIKSAMGDLTGDELAGVTRSSAILAAATKADTATITNYMGTMYSVFKDQADRIGKDNWAEQVAGMTAKSVEMFKTTGQGMSDAFKSVGALGKTHGVAIQEQMAVLGLLQGSMSGSEAGTRYKAFMNGVVKAQDKLGIAFTDSNGKMLPMFDIMSKLRNQFGELDSLEINQIKQAFGSDKAVMLITDLIGKTSDLQSSVQDLNEASHLNTAIEMAHSMTDQWERLEQGVFAVRTAFGAALLPSLLPVVSSLADGAMEIIEWTELFPNITKWIGYAGISLLSFVAINGLLTMAVGIGKQAMASYILVTKGFGLAVAGVNSILKMFKVAMLAANIAMMANPIGLVIGAAVAAVAAVGALIYYWDDLKATFGDTRWFQVLEGALSLITMPFKAMFAFIKAGWQWVMSGFTDTSGFAFIGQMVSRLKGGFESLIFGWKALTAGVADTWWFSVVTSAIERITLPFRTFFQFLSAGWQWVMSGFTDTSGFAFIGQVVSRLKGGFESLMLGWRMLTATLADTWWCAVISSAVDLMALPFHTLFNFLSAGWQWVMSGFTDTSGFAFIGEMADHMRNIFGNVFSWFTDKLAGIWKNLKELVDWVPGFGGDDESIQVKSKSVQSATPYAQVQPGGAAKSIASYQTNSTNYGGVAIYPTYMSSPQDMASELEMAAG
ncbi:phage tail tape measure protein [Vibrio sp. AND4]|uniref:phage tail tape measure protein n=1 Tax=Vibrio sp. AND4 TaxID=314289 RepID=UPI00015EFE77|nr:phage tail tape measure protein [Vibrio sp. AND4]EDP59437.1 phage tail tape measure protein, TP901 family [Vibrio sp. AND4]